ncbi:hypothetical protein CR513_56232, partial [Mucuna pruriens]
MSTTADVEHSPTLFTLFAGAPFPRDMTRRSSTPFTDGKSRLLWRTCVTAAAAGLFITRPPSTEAHEVFPSTEAKWKGSKRPGVADVARHAFQSSKLKLGDSDASARENTNGAELLRSKQGIRSGLHSQQPSFFLFSLEHSLQRLFHAPRGESPAAVEHAGALRLVEFAVVFGDEADGISGGVERAAEAVVGGYHGGEEGANAGTGDDVEVIGDLGVGIGGLGADLILKVEEGGAGNNGGGSSAVDAEYAGFGCGFVVGEPLLLKFGEDL